MQVKFVRDDGKVFILDGSCKGGADWGITEISGTDTIENSMGSAVPAVGDGEVITSERIPSRNIDIFASVKDRRKNQEERRKALSFFNPKQGFTLYITKGGVTRWAKARQERFQCREAAPDRHVSMSAAIKCMDPYFYSVDNYGKNIAAVMGCFGFPYISPLSKGFRTGVYNFAKVVSVENNGDAGIRMKVVITADGLVKNPKIILNGAYVRIIDMLGAGDILEIDLERNTIRKNGENCIGKIDRHSSFTGMELLTGENEVSFDADNGDTNMKVVLYYYLRYLGV